MTTVLLLLNTFTLLSHGPRALRLKPCAVQCTRAPLHRMASAFPAASPAPESDDSTGTTSAWEYLDSLSRVADDGRLLLNAPQRYSSKDWVHNLVSIRKDVVFSAVRGQLFWQLLWALAVSLLYIRFPRIPPVPALPHSLLGGVLGVLLGFRTNQSYDRFWEGRKLWGRVFEKCRSVARISLACIDANEDIYHAVMRHLKAFPIALKQHLRGEFSISEFRGLLDVREVNELASGDNLPLTVCMSLSMTLNALKLDTSQSGHLMLWWVLENELSQLAAVVADCERLVRTPVPVEYSTHTSRLLSLWTGTLPFVLVGCFQGGLRILTAPVTAFVGYALFCTEELGHLIEEPFGAHEDRPEVLPLDRYCKSLIADLEAEANVKRRALRLMGETRSDRMEEETLSEEDEVAALQEEAEAENALVDALAAAEAAAAEAAAAAAAVAEMGRMTS